MISQHKTNLQLLVDGAVEKYAKQHLLCQDLFDLVEHDIRNLGLPLRDYNEAMGYLKSFTIGKG